MGELIPGSGFAELEALVVRLSAHPATARHVGGKLCVWGIGEGLVEMLISPRLMTSVGSTLLAVATLVWGWGVTAGVVGRGDTHGALTMDYPVVGATLGLPQYAFVALIAALNLVLDFERIQRLKRQRQMEAMVWYQALGLLVSLSWMYVSILRWLASVRR